MACVLSFSVADCLGKHREPLVDLYICGWSVKILRKKRLFFFFFFLLLLTAISLMFDRQISRCQIGHSRFSTFEFCGVSWS